MTQKLMSRSTDLNVLRSMLMNDDDSLSVNKTENNEVRRGDEVKVNDNMETLNVEIINPSHKNISIISNKNNTAKSKLNNTRLERGPFLITRINTRHKQHSLNTEKSSDDKRSLSQLNSYKSIHYKNIIDKENHLQQKFQQLTNILDKDVVARTAAICDQSMNEARQLIQNSLATSRIISSFITERQNSIVPTDSFENLHISPEILSSNMFPCNISATPKGRLTTLFHSNDHSTGFNTEGNDFNIDGQDKKYNIKENNKNNIIQNDFTFMNCFNMTTKSLDTHNDNELRQSMSAKRVTDHKLNSDEPFIQNWFQSKNREFKKLKNHEIQTKRIEKAIRINAERVLEQRHLDAKEAFKLWCKRKASKNKVKEDETISASDSDDDKLPQAGRQPRQIHNYVNKKPQLVIRPKTTASFNIRSDLKMKLKGHKMELIPVEISYEFSRLSRTLHDDNNIKKFRPQTAIPRAREDLSKSLTLPMQTKYFPEKPPIRILKKKKKKKSQQFTFSDFNNYENTQRSQQGSLKEDNGSEIHNYRSSQKDYLVEDKMNNPKEDLSRSVSIESMVEYDLF